MIPHPPVPLLQQEKGEIEYLGGYPQTPTREAQPLWTLSYAGVTTSTTKHKNRDSMGGEALWRGFEGVPYLPSLSPQRIVGMGVEIAIFEGMI